MRESVLEMVTTMGKVEQEYGRGFRLASILDPSSPAFQLPLQSSIKQLDDDHHRLLCDYLDRSMELDHMPRLAKFMRQVSINNIVYGTSGSSTFRNSSIIFREIDATSCDQKAALIQEIFMYDFIHTNGQAVQGTFMTIKELRPLEDPSFDPYRKYSFGGFLCQSEMTALRIIGISQVVSHFAHTKMLAAPFEGLIHVLPLDRVSNFF